MALNRVPVPVPMASGLDRKTDPKQAPVGRLLVCQNARFDQSSTLRKRNGYSAFSRTVTDLGTEYVDATALAARGTETVLLTESTAYSYQASIGTWNKIGPVASVSASDESVAHTATNQSTPDAATNEGVTILAWEDSRGGVWWTLLEAEGGRVLRAPEQVDADGQRPRCLAVGNVLHLVYATTLTELRILVVNPAMPTATATPVALTTDLDATNPSFDALSGDAALITWARSSGGYRIGYLHQSGVLGSPVTGLDPVVDNVAVTFDVGPIIAYDGDTRLVIVVHDTGTQNTSIVSHSVDDALIVSSTETVAEAVDVVRLAASFHATDDTSILVFREVDAATDRDHYVRVGQYTDGGALVEVATHRGCGIASSAFIDDTRVHVWLVHDVEFFTIYLCLRQEDDGSYLVVARALPGTAYGLPPRAHVPRVESTGRSHTWCGSWQQQIATDESSTFAEVGIRRVTLDFDAVGSWQTAQLGRSLYIGGSCPLIYDGDTVTEADFHYAPDDIAAPAQGTTGALTALGTYVYRAVYEWIDAQGELHQGATSVGTLVTMTGANDSVTLTLPTYRLTDKRVRIGVFRTEANDADGGLYRVTSLDPSATGANGFVASNPAVDTVTFTDELSDASLITREPLYTNGGIPSNDPTGAGSVLVAGKRRLFYTDPSDPLMVRYTQALQDGHGVEFNNELSFKVDPYGGDVTALAVMDDRVIVFKRTAIFAVSGPGPLANPQADPSQGFSEAALVTSDAGCTAPASIAVTPVGIVFQSAKGIYLLGRDLSVSYVGAPVEAFNSQVVTRATLIEDRRQIVFLCASGETLMYDYGAGQWSTYTNHTGLDAAVIAGTYHYLRTDGRVFRETVDSYRDDNSQIRMVLETAWIKMVPFLQGFSRFYHLHIIGERRSPHTIRFRYQTDYMAGWSAPNDVDWTAESGDAYGDGDYGEGVYGGDAPEIYQWKVHLGETGQAIRFRFEDIEATDTFGASYELSELLITGGVKSSAVRPLPAARTR